MGLFVDASALVLVLVFWCSVTICCSAVRGLLVY